MQYSITAVSTILFASAITSAAAIPRQASQDANINIRVGGGDVSTVLTIHASDFGTLITKDAQGLALEGVALGTSTAGILCGVFDPITAAPLVNSTTKAPLTVTSTAVDGVVPFGKNGDKGNSESKAENAIPFGFCCDQQANYAKSCAKPAIKPESQGSNNAAGGAAAGAATCSEPPATSNNAPSSGPATATSQGSTESFSVNMQFFGVSELSVFGNVLADGNPHPVSNTVGIQTIHITEQDKPVQCKAFADVAGKNQVGSLFNNVPTGDKAFLDFSDEAGIDVNAVSCTPIAW